MKFEFNIARQAAPHKSAAVRPLTTHHETIKIRRTKHAGNCWRSRDELIGDVLLWTPSHGRAKAGRPARTYIHQLCVDTGCSSEAMDDRYGWWERVRDIFADGITWWWWWWLHSIWRSYFNLAKFFNYGENNEMKCKLKILRFFINRSGNIIMDRFYNKD